MLPLLASVLIFKMSKLSAAQNNVIIPTSRPTSPTRFTMNALRAASEFGFSSHQWPMSTNEQSPTSSQLVMNCTVLRLMTSSNIDAVNSDRNAK